MYSRFYQEMEFNEYRFKLFALRDRLTILVMSRNIEESSVEHETLLRLINGSIEATENFKVTDFIRFLVEVSENSDIKNYLDQIYTQLEEVNNIEYAAILNEFYKISDEQLTADLRLFRILIKFMSGTAVNSKKEKIDNAKDHIQNARSSFGRFATAANAT